MYEPDKVVLPLKNCAIPELLSPRLHQALPFQKQLLHASFTLRATRHVSPRVLQHLLYFLLSSDWQPRVLQFHPFFTFSRDQLRRNPWVCAKLYASLSKIYASLHIHFPVYMIFPIFLVFLRQFETIYTSAGRDWRYFMYLFETQKPPRKLDHQKGQTTGKVREPKKIDRLPQPDGLLSL